MEQTVNECTSYRGKVRCMKMPLRTLDLKSSIVWGTLHLACTVIWAHILFGHSIPPQPRHTFEVLQKIFSSQQKLSSMVSQKQASEYLNFNKNNASQNFFGVL